MNVFFLRTDVYRIRAMDERKVAKTGVKRVSIPYRNCTQLSLNLL